MQTHETISGLPVMEANQVEEHYLVNCPDCEKQFELVFFDNDEETEEKKPLRLFSIKMLETLVAVFAIGFFFIGGCALALHVALVLSSKL